MHMLIYELYDAIHNMLAEKCVINSTLGRRLARQGRGHEQ